MANAILRTCRPNKALQVLGLFSLLLLIQKGSAHEFKVGGSNGWSTPADSNSASYNQWAESKRFQIGDTLLFVYPANKDSVLLVSKEDFDNCNSANPLETYSDGHTVYQFTKSGPHYFISGVEQHCHRNQKLVVVVMADRTNHSPKTDSSIIMTCLSFIGAFLVSSSPLLVF